MGLSFLFVGGEEMANKLKNLKITSVDLCKQGANPEAYIKFYKSNEEVEKVEFETEQVKRFVDEILKANDEDEIKNIAKKFEDELLEDNEEEDMAKGFVLEEMEDADRDNLKSLMKKYKVGNAEDKNDDKDEKLKKSIEEYDEIIEKTKEAKRDLEIITKAKEFEKYEAIGKDPQDIAKKYLELNDINEEMASDYLSLLDEQVTLQEETGIFKSFGKNKESATGWEAIENIAKSYLEEGKAKNKYEAIAKACEQHPEHVREYEKEL